MHVFCSIAFAHYLRFNLRALVQFSGYCAGLCVFIDLDWRIVKEIIKYILMKQVQAKKNLGQHFLTNLDIARDIVDAVSVDEQSKTKVLEIGPGMGVLTNFLLERKSIDLSVVEIDRESVAWLKHHYPSDAFRIIEGDFLRMPMSDYYGAEPFIVVGNFPYNISSQILFRVLEMRDQVPQLVGMFQKEVAQRLCSGPGSKDYGILSVFLQAFYVMEYLFTVGENEFNPPPKVKSGVIRMKRNDVVALPCDEKLFVAVVKAAFNQRRKMLRNSIKMFIKKAELFEPYLTKRPEQLSVHDFIILTQLVEQQKC